MSRTFKPQVDILPLAQKLLWPKLRSVRESGFVLYGGTAIALRLGHRASADFDFFTEKPLNKNKLRQDLLFLKESELLQDSPDSLTVLVPSTRSKANQVKVSFFGSINVGRVGVPEITNDDVLEVASLQDLFALKLKVILQRIEAKDYLDIAALLKSGLSLSLGLASARALYESTFQPAESLKALVYFEGEDLSSLSEETKAELIFASSNVKSIPSMKIIASILSAEQ